MRILLIRHGPSAHSAPPGLLDRAGVERWRAAYDSTGIASHSPPPQALVDRVAAADVALASDLPRAAASAARLWPGRCVECSPLFREIPLRIPTCGNVRAPFAIWSLAIHLQWGLDILSGRDLSATDRQRVAGAAAWCEDACRDHRADAVFALVTHGVFRRVLARQLVTHGWELSGARHYDPWSVWTLTRRDAPSRPLAKRSLKLTNDLGLRMLRIRSSLFDSFAA